VKNRTKQFSLQQKWHNLFQDINPYKIIFLHNLNVYTIQDQLVFQNDGNLVLYRNSDGHAMWTTGTSGSRAIKAVMQEDGNLGIYWHMNFWTLLILATSWKNNNTVVLNHGVASFFWCVAKSDQTLTLSFWYMNLALVYTKQ
jgi:hypothetical protein